MDILFERELSVCVDEQIFFLAYLPRNLKNINFYVSFSASDATSCAMLQFCQISCCRMGHKVNMECTKSSSVYYTHINVCINLYTLPQAKCIHATSACKYH